MKLVFLFQLKFQIFRNKPTKLVLLVIRHVVSVNLQNNKYYINVKTTRQMKYQTRGPKPYVAVEESIELDIRGIAHEFHTRTLCKVGHTRATMQNHICEPFNNVVFSAIVRDFISFSNKFYKTFPGKNLNFQGHKHCTNIYLHYLTTEISSKSRLLKYNIFL